MLLLRPLRPLLTVETTGARHRSRTGRSRKVPVKATVTNQHKAAPEPSLVAIHHPRTR